MIILIFIQPTRTGETMRWQVRRVIVVQEMGVVEVVFGVEYWLIKTR